MSSHHPDKNHHRAHVMHVEHHWVAQHPHTVAFILAVIISGLIVLVSSVINLNISTGVWPLFG